MYENTRYCAGCGKMVTDKEIISCSKTNVYCEVSRNKTEARTFYVDHFKSGPEFLTEENKTSEM